MNNNQRKKLKEAQTHLGMALGIVSTIKDEEQDKLDNTPKNLQNSERYTIMENAIDELEEAVDNIKQATECIDNVF